MSCDAHFMAGKKRRLEIEQEKMHIDHVADKVGGRKRNEKCRVKRCGRGLNEGEGRSDGRKQLQNTAALRL